MPFTLARPDLLALLALLPAAALLFAHARRQRRRALATLGSVTLLRNQFEGIPARRGRSRLLVLLSLSLIIVVLAGPRWGVGDPGIIRGRDLMISIDLSKSMLADDMRDPAGERAQRWQAAKRSVRELVESIRQRGGHRVGLVLFAGRPWVVCPLTSDYEHFLMRLDEYDPLAPPAEVNPPKGEQAPSGTRLGAGMAEAVRWQDERFPGQRDVLLLSDGDDPADDRDTEVAAALEFVRDARVPVHTVGLGDPTEGTTLTYKRSDGEEEVVGPTRLHEQPLKEIARATRGSYLPAHRVQPDLANWFRTQIEPTGSRELPDDALPQPRDRAVWFLLPAIVLLLAAWWIET